MSYLGRTPFSYGFTKLDTPAFNGVLTSFPITKGGIAFAPGNAMGLLISVAGVIQEPFVDFNVSNSTITFNAAHATGVKFFGVSFANQYAIGTIADSTVSTAKLQDGSVTNAKIGEAITILNGGTGGTTTATARTNLGLGSAALLTAGTSANNAVQLTAAAKLPAVDGSLLTGISTTPADGSITGAKLSGAQTGSAPIYGVRAWCTFNGGSTGTNAPTVGGNVSSVTRNGVGTYTITLTTAMPSSQFAVVIANAAQNTFITSYASSTTSAVVLIANNAGALYDGATVSLLCIG